MNVKERKVVYCDKIGAHITIDVFGHCIGCNLQFYCGG